MRTGADRDKKAVNHTQGTRSPPLPLMVYREESVWRYEGGITRPILILWRYDAQGAC
jgi:hypothetical protein